MGDSETSVWNPRSQHSYTIIVAMLEPDLVDGHSESSLFSLPHHTALDTAFLPPVFPAFLEEVGLSCRIPWFTKISRMTREFIKAPVVVASCL